MLLKLISLLTPTKALLTAHTHKGTAHCSHPQRHCSLLTPTKALLTAHTHKGTAHCSHPQRHCSLLTPTKALLTAHTHKGTAHCSHPQRHCSLLTPTKALLTARTHTRDFVFSCLVVEGLPMGLDMGLLLSLCSLLCFFIKLTSVCRRSLMEEASINRFSSPAIRSSFAASVFLYASSMRASISSMRLNSTKIWPQTNAVYKCRYVAA